MRAWIGLEINLLSFIPLIRESKNLISTEASIKYFLTQALASAIILFAVILILLNNLIDELNNYFSIIILISLFLKRGVAPFHFWFPNVIEGLSWINGLILITWQKIAPFILISYLLINYLIIFTVICSALLGTLGGLNQTSLRKLIAFSSINHISWILIAILARESLWIIYFLIYCFLSLSIGYLFNTFNIFHIHQIFSIHFTSKTIKFILCFNLLSLGGLPPFLGFAPKWLVIQTLTAQRQLILITFLTITTLIALFFYLRLCYSAFMFNYYETNWIQNIQPNINFINLYSILSFLSILGLPLIWLFYLIL